MLLNMVGAGAAGGGLPTFTYTGQAQLIDDGKVNGKQNWRIRLLSSGTLAFQKDLGSIDVFLVGGGGGGSTGNNGQNGGGGGGYTATHKGFVLTKGTEYPIVIGAGGIGPATWADGGAGGTTSAFNYEARGGNGGTKPAGGNGGSGGGTSYAGPGGSDGSNGGTTSSYPGGRGQGTTTREFGETTGELYSGGGGAGDAGDARGQIGGAGGGGDGWMSSAPAKPGQPNTGGGGGGGSYYNGQLAANRGREGGTGIVVIRNHRQ